MLFSKPLLLSACIQTRIPLGYMLSLVLSGRPTTMTPASTRQPNQTTSTNTSRQRRQRTTLTTHTNCRLTASRCIHSRFIPSPTPTKPKTQTGQELASHPASQLEPSKEPGPTVSVVRTHTFHINIYAHGDDTARLFLRLCMYRVFVHRFVCLCLGVCVLPV